ncbi:glycosyltransferase family 2 protein [Mycolicibacterium pyrenivorans]|uniref:glycosyltransferase family 2 protein n=1 Tax=Mycolicibacterium pyrenivorans TaxID=187102 RepID=UPI0021F28222|nr:glycosyltransferase [Mycolicibacterium pyrenivorans]MCV7152504.1 glycosyltransferase [Mycolicibacterium pyrenivorans]
MTDNGDNSEPELQVAVVIACYTEERWDRIGAALDSLRDQTLRPGDVVVGVDNNWSLAARLAAQFPDLTVVLNEGPRGASTTRNRAVDVVKTPLTAFLDDDEIAHRDWLFELTRPFAEPGVIGTGGRYRDVWSHGRPPWFPPEFAWAVGGAYAGMPTVTSQVRNVWSGNMAVRTAAFRTVGGFRTDFGKRGAVSQPEDTDLCLRMADRGDRWMYVPSAVIDHEVPQSRSSLRFFVTRCYTEGAGKALMQSNFDDKAVLSAERSYALRTGLTALRRLTSARPRPMLQGLVMILGFMCAGLGYTVCSYRARLARMRSAAMTADAVTHLPIEREAASGTPRAAADGAA